MDGWVEASLLSHTTSSGLLLGVLPFQEAHYDQLQRMPVQRLCPEADRHTLPWAGSRWTTSSSDISPSLFSAQTLLRSPRGLLRGFLQCPGEALGAQHRCLRSHWWKPGGWRGKLGGRPGSSGSAWALLLLYHLTSSLLPQEFIWKDSLGGNELKITVLPQFSQCKREFEMHPALPMLPKTKCTAAQDPAFTFLLGFAILHVRSWSRQLYAAQISLMTTANCQTTADARHEHLLKPHLWEGKGVLSPGRLCLGHALSFSPGGPPSQRYVTQVHLGP